MAASRVTEAVFSLYELHGHGEYYGEKVSQLEHAIQCAMLAEQEGCSQQEVLGAFLHDIGHLIRDSQPMMSGTVTLGSMRHDITGAEFLESLGVPNDVISLCRWHVDAKRYLCYKDAEYYQKLSDASKMTLEHQGGPMNAAEAEEFDVLPNKEKILRGRQWDEMAKVEGKKMESVNRYREMFMQMMTDVLVQKA